MVIKRIDYKLNMKRVRLKKYRGIEAGFEDKKYKSKCGMQKMKKQLNLIKNIKKSHNTYKRK